MKAPVRNKTFAAFAAAVRASCEEHAQRKNYTNSNVDGESLLTMIMQQIGIHRQHCIAEIVTKAIEYLKNSAARACSKRSRDGRLFCGEKLRMRHERARVLV